MHAEEDVVGPSATGASVGDGHAANIRRIVLITGMILLVVVLEYLTRNSHGALTYHLIYRRLCFAPIIYAAFVFGWRGGLFAAVACSVSYAIQVAMLFGTGQVANADNAVQVGLFVAAGVLFGAVSDMKEAKARDLRQVSSQLEEAYRKLEERAFQLADARDYTMAILTSITSGVFTVEQGGLVVAANPAAERMLEEFGSKAASNHISQVFADDGGISADVEKVLSGELLPALHETDVVTHDGRHMCMQVSISRMRVECSGSLGAVLTLGDVSAMRMLTERIIRADRLVVIGEFTSVVAHEIRNPLGVIRAGIQLLEDAEYGTEGAHESTEVIKQEIDRLDQKIKGLLDFGRPDRPTFIETDVNAVLDDVSMFAGNFAEQLGVLIVKELADSVPEVMADPDKLKQVFLNLGTNAIQAMGDGGGVITVRTWAENGSIHISVADDGPGIPENELNKVFEPFFTKRADGTGLGLAIVRRIVDQHEGDVSVDSSPEGTTFTVSLPTIPR